MEVDRLLLSVGPHRPLVEAVRSDQAALSKTPPPNNHSARRAELFRSMGYKPALAETEQLLARAAAPAT
jgi:hypothetical protein